jgi:hypothetical protein
MDGTRSTRRCGVPVLMIHYQEPKEGVREVVDAIETAFAAVRPEGLRYASYRWAGSNEFLAPLEPGQSTEKPLPGIRAARDRQSTVA